MSGKVTVKDLREMGRSCSEVMMEMTMNVIGTEDPNLIKAMKGLAGGMGIRHACGILTGAACAFSLVDQENGPKTLFPEFYAWFYDTYGEEHDGVNCIELLDGDFEKNKMILCPGMIEQSWNKALEILTEHGYAAK